MQTNTEKPVINIKKATKDITQAWQAIQASVDNLAWGFSDAERLLHQTLDESKRHNQGRIGPRSISIITEAKYFAVKRILECIRDNYKPEIKNLWHLQQSVFGAYGLVHDETTSALIQQAYSANKELCDRVATYDYCDLIKG